MKLGLVLSAAVFWASAALAEEPALPVRARVQALGLSSADEAAVLAPLSQAEAAALPTGPVGEKILEGLAKHVPPARVAAAAQGVLARLTDASAALEKSPSSPADRPRALVALALAEARLGSREPLLELATRAAGARAEALVAAATTCADLRDAGVPVAESIPLLGTMAARGYRPEHIAAVPGLLRQYRQEGGQDVSAFAEALSRRAATGKDLSDVVDPFGAHGQILRREGADRSEAAPLKERSRGEGGRVLVESPDRGGSTPAADDDLAARTGRGGVGQPPSGATSGGGNAGRGKGKGRLSADPTGKDPSQP